MLRQVTSGLAVRRIAATTNTMLMSTMARTPSTTLSSRLTKKVTHPRLARHTKSKLQKLLGTTTAATTNNANFNYNRVASHLPPDAPATSALGMVAAGLTAGAVAAYAMGDSRADAQASSTYMPTSKAPPAPTTTTLKDTSEGGVVTDKDVLVKDPGSGMFFPLTMPADASISARRRSWWPRAACRRGTD